MIKYRNFVLFLIISILISPIISFSLFCEDFSQSWNEMWTSQIRMTDEHQIYSINQENNTLYIQIQKPSRSSNYLKFHSKYVIKGKNYSISFLLKKKGYGRTTQGVYFNSSNYFVVGLDTNDANYLYIHSFQNNHLYVYNLRSSDPYKNRIVNFTIIRNPPFFDVYADGELLGTYYYPAIENITNPRVFLWHEIMAWKSGDLNDERYLVVVNDGPRYVGKVLDVKKDNGIFNATIRIEKDGAPYTHGFDSYYTHVYLEGQECQQVFYYNNFDGTYNILFYEPRVKILGNLDLVFDILIPDGNRVVAKGTLLQKTKKKSHLLFITDGNFYDTLFVSVLNQPVLIYQEFNVSFNGSSVRMDNFNGISEFIRRYDPNEIFYLGLKGEKLDRFQQTFGGYLIKDKEFIKEIWSPNTFVLIDGNKTKDILAGKIAVMLNAQLTMDKNISNYSDKIICTYDCNIENATVLSGEDQIEEFIKSNSKYVNSMTIVNVEDNLSAFSPQIFRYRNSVPIVVNIKPKYVDAVSNYENGIFSIEDRMEKTYKWAKNLRDPLLKAKDEFFVYLVGAPYGYLYDPGIELINDYDGEFLYTDVLYSDTNIDGERDFSVGRITDPLQIHNANDFNSRKRKVLIIGEYRHSKYIDIVPGGMESSLLVELATKSLGINTKRYAERRLQDMSEFQDEDFLDRYLTWYQLEEYFIQRILKAIGIQKYVNWALTYKYALVEFDWWNFVKHGEIKTLPMPTKEDVLNDLENKNVVFFFGIGDNYSWILPPDKDPGNRDLIFDPYPEDSPRIYAEDVINHSSLIYDDHSMGGHPESAFVHSSLACYGPSGIVHDPISVVNFMGYFYLFGHGSSLGFSSRPFTTKVVTYKEKTILNKIKEGASILKRELLLKDYIQRNLYGDPMITLRENYILEKPKYKIEYSDGKFKIKVSKKFKTKEIGNETNQTNRIPEVEDLNGYVMDYNKPIVPVKVYEFDIPKGAKVKSFNYTILTHKEENVTIPILKSDEHYPTESFTGQYPENFVENMTFEGLDKKILVVTVFPIIYKNETSSEAEIIDDIQFEIEYDSPIGIVSFNAINGTNNSNITFTADIVANGTVNITLIIFSSNKTVELNYTGNIPGEDVFNFKWENATIGNYTAVLIVTQEDNEARSFDTFNVHERGVFVGSVRKFHSPEKMGYEIKTPFEKLLYVKFSGREEFSYWSENCYINITRNSNNEIKTFITISGHLTIFKNSTDVIRHLQTPKGEITSILSSGEIQEKIIGDRSLRNELSKMIENYNSNITSIKRRLEAGEFPI